MASKSKLVMPSLVSSSHPGYNGNTIELLAKVKVTSATEIQPLAFVTLAYTIWLMAVLSKLVGVGIGFVLEIASASEKKKFSKVKALLLLVTSVSASNKL